MTTQQTNSRISGNVAFQPYDGVDSLDIIGPGFNIGQLPRLAAYRQFQQWYRNDFSSLYAETPSLTNGLTLFDFRDLKRLPIFSIASKFYQDSILARRPNVHTQDDALSNWLASNARQIFSTLDKAMEYWSVCGTGVIATYTSNKIRQIDPAWHIPVQNPQDKDEIIGHAVMFPWYARTGGDIAPSTQRSMNRVTVVKYLIETDASTVETFEMAGLIIGNRLTGPDPSDLNGVFTFGNGVGFYGDMQGPVGEMMVAWTLLGRRVNRFSDPHLLLPQSSSGATITLPDGTTVPTTLAQGGADARRSLLDGRGAMIEVPGETTGQYGYLQADVEIIATLDMMQWLSDVIYIASGVPPTSYGVSVGRGESGEARKQAMQRSAQLISEIRFAVELLFPEAARNIGAPVPEVNTGDHALTFVWPDDPFEDRQESVQTMLNMLDKGELQKGEVRVAAGWPPYSDEELNEQRAQQDARDSLAATMLERTNGNGNNQGGNPGDGRNPNLQRPERG